MYFPSQKQQPLKLILRETELKFDENYCNITTNHVTKFGEIISLTYQMEIFVEVKTFFVKVGIALPNANGKFESFIQNSVTDMCKYLKNSKSNIIMRLFFNGHFDAKKFTPSCPVKPGIYYIENFRINENMLTIRAIETRILITVDFCTSVPRDKMYCGINMKFHAEVKDRMKWQKELEKYHQSDN